MSYWGAAAALLLCTLLASLPCSDSFSLSPTPVPSLRTRMAMIGRTRGGLVGSTMQSSSSSPPKTPDAYRFESVGDSLPSRDSGKVAWPHLAPARFTHPLDTQATRTLKRLPFAEGLVRQGFGGMVEQAIYLDNLSNSVRVGPKQLPDIYAMLQEAKHILGLSDLAVDIFVRQNPAPNAYTMAMQGQKPFIVLHSSLISLLSKQELQAVIAHELGHLKCEHGVWITLSNIITVFASQLPGNLGRTLGESLTSSTLRWLRAAELSCDRAALLVAQDPRTVVSVIMKLSGGGAGFGQELNPDDFARQARDFEQESERSWMFRRMRDALTSQLSHPLPVERVRELDKWSKSADYRALLSGGTPMKGGE